VNEQIRIPQVRLIGEDGEQIGIMETRKAMELAQEKDLDLVEVSPEARPPVCRVMDYGKYRYEMSKKQKKGKQASSQLKEIRLRPQIDDHDYTFKLKHVEEFLKQRHKVRVTVFFRGRQHAHRDQGRELLERVKVDLSEVGVPEGNIQDEGRNMVLIVTPR
jgi:translation initiation factor IF-3